MISSSKIVQKRTIKAYEMSYIYAKQLYHE